MTKIHALMDLRVKYESVTTRRSELRTISSATISTVGLLRHGVAKYTTIDQVL